MIPAKPHRTLLIARHAEAEPEAIGLGDHERALTRRGKDQAEQGRLWLSKQPFSVTATWASDAVRTQQTALAFATDEAGETGSVRLMPELYACAEHQMLAAVAHADDEVNALLVVGHQPTVAGVVAVITGRHLDFPPGTIAAIGVDCPWAEVDHDSGWVLEVFRPTD